MNKVSNTSEHFFLFPSCKLVRGMAYSAIYDLERRRLHRFSSQYFNLFKIAAGKNGLWLGDIDKLSDSSREAAISGITYLIQNELGYFGGGPLPMITADLSERWNEARAITSSIIDVDENLHDFKTIFRQLDELQCAVVQIRSFKKLFNPIMLVNILEEAKGTTVQRLELLIHYTPELESIDWQALFGRFQYLVVVELHSAEMDRVDEYVLGPGLRHRLVAFRSEPVPGQQGCGSINLETLNVPTVKLYNELKSFNGCLNRKLSIRSNGEICNCPSLSKSYGSDLENIVHVSGSSEFREPWTINKDSIEVCRSCEFRYVCTDCRANLPLGAIYAKPTRCTYDPGTGVWAKE